MTRPNVNVGTAATKPRPEPEYRYGIFIRPPREISIPALEIMRTVRDLFGFHAAMAYPPHITLIGSIVLNGTEEDLIKAIGTVLADRKAIAVHGRGLNAAIGAAVGIDYSRTADGAPNSALADLYADLHKATLALQGYEPSDRKADARREKAAKEHFRAHLTVLGHDGVDNPTIRDEARALVEPLAERLPADWAATTVTLYRFWSNAWHSEYWLTQEWIPLASWTLR